MRSNEQRRKLYSRGKGSDHFLNSRAIVSVADQAIVSITAFVTGALIGRTVSVEELGLYTLGLSLILVVVDIQIALVATPHMVRFPHLARPREREFSGSSLIHHFAISVTIMAGMALAVPVLGFVKGLSFFYAIFYPIFSIILFINLREFLRRFFFTKMEVVTAFFLDIASSLIQVCGIFVLWKISALSAVNSLWLIGLSSAIPTIFLLCIRRSDFTFSFKAAVLDSRANLAIGKWVLLSSVFWATGSHLYPWLIVSASDKEAVGIWGACLSIIAIARMPMTGIQNFLGPKISEMYSSGGIDGLRTFTSECAAKFATLMLVFSVLLGLTGERLVLFVFGPEFENTTWTITLVALSLVPAAVGFCQSRALFVLERADLESWVTLLPLAVLLFPGYLLISRFGIVGAAVSYFGANTLASVVRWFILLRLFRTMKVV